MQDLAALIRRVTGAEAPAALVTRVHARMQEDAATMAEVMRCLAAEPSDVRPALQALVTMNARSPEADPELSLFRHEGEYWTIAFAGSVAHLRDRRGLHYLARLLARPGERIPTEELVARAAPGRVAMGPDRARVSVTKAIANALVHLASCHPALAEHLGASIHRGRSCSYRPDSRVPIRWIT
jgi:hypothetical protein